MAKYRIVECINTVWECEANSEKDAKAKYLEHTHSKQAFLDLIYEGNSEVEVYEINDQGDCV